MSWAVDVVRNRYVDSVRLMKIAKDLRAADGVTRAEVAMGTPANLELLAGLGIDCAAEPGDVVVAVEGPADALELARRELAPPAAADGRERALDPPRSLTAAMRRLAGANVALISVPGEYAALEAHRALTEGLHAFLFSDHVSVDQEIELKQRGADLGLLVMGPGCGTAMLGQVGLGFANVVRPGPVGIVAAAGTGAQEAAVLLDGAEVGVSQIIGVGGRDLSSAVGGIMFREAMRALAEDDETETLLLVSKPPAPDVVRRLGDVDVDGKRVVAAFVGWNEGDAPFEVHPTLEGGVYAAARTGPPDLAELEARVDAARSGGRLLGLYSGGSLAHEAVTILAPALGRIGGNAGAGGEEGHAIFDLGDEEYTQGRPHPMIDLELRRELLERAAAADDLGCVLLDIVIGHGSHADPAGGLAPALSALSGDRPVIAHVCGTAADPQDGEQQAATLREAGVIVAPTNAAGARLAARALA